MKQLSDYIIEKANFLVKKHITKQPNGGEPLKSSDLEEGQYVKVTWEPFGTAEDIKLWMIGAFDRIGRFDIDKEDKCIFKYGVSYSLLNIDPRIAILPRISLETGNNKTVKYTTVNQEESEMLDEIASHIKENNINTNNAITIGHLKNGKLYFDI